MALAVCLSFVSHHFMKAMGEKRPSYLVSAGIVLIPMKKGFNSIACTVQCAMELKLFMEVYYIIKGRTWDIPYSNGWQTFRGHIR